MREWLKKARKNAGLRQIDMAKSIGVSHPHYCEIENGTRQRDMSLSMVGKLAVALHKSEEEILRLERDGE